MTGKLPVAHVTALLAEAGALQRKAARQMVAGNPAQAAALLADARLLAEDAASYTLPSGLRLSVTAMLEALDRQLDQLVA